jgi:hypothetical protein
MVVRRHRSSGYEATDIETVAEPIVDRSATITTDDNPSYKSLDQNFHARRSRQAISCAP